MLPAVLAFAARELSVRTGYSKVQKDGSGDQ